FYFFFFSSRRRHTRFSRDWSSDVCSSDLTPVSVQYTVVDDQVISLKKTLAYQDSHLPVVDEAELQADIPIRGKIVDERGETLPRSEERREGKSVDVGGRRSIKRNTGIRRT